MYELPVKVGKLYFLIKFASRRTYTKEGDTTLDSARLSSHIDLLHFCNPNRNDGHIKLKMKKMQNSTQEKKSESNDKPIENIKKATIPAPIWNNFIDTHKKNLKFM